MRMLSRGVGLVPGSPRAAALLLVRVACGPDEHRQHELKGSARAASHPLRVSLHGLLLSTQGLAWTGAGPLRPLLEKVLLQLRITNDRVQARLWPLELYHL